MGYRVYKFILVGRIYAKSNYLIKKAPFYRSKDPSECLKIWRLLVALLYLIAKLELETIKVEITDFPFFSHQLIVQNTKHIASIADSKITLKSL